MRFNCFTSISYSNYFSMSCWIHILYYSIYSFSNYFSIANLSYWKIKIFKTFV